MITCNIAHYAQLAEQLASDGKTHYGIVVSRQLEFGELLRRTVNLLQTRSAEEMVNRFDWLQNYK